MSSATHIGEAEVVEHISFRGFVHLRFCEIHNAINGIDAFCDLSAARFFFEIPVFVRQHVSACETFYGNDHPIKNRRNVCSMSFCKEPCRQNASMRRVNFTNRRLWRSLET
jgi:hypothetical protein